MSIQNSRDGFQRMSTRRKNNQETRAKRNGETLSEYGESRYHHSMITASNGSRAKGIPQKHKISASAGTSCRYTRSIKGNRISAEKRKKQREGKPGVKTATQKSRKDGRTQEPVPSWKLCTRLLSVYGYPARRALMTLASGLEK